jgi:alkylated DNA repair dioxygenase AlkB
LPVDNAILRLLPLPDASIYFAGNFFTPAQSNAFFKELQENTAWRQENIKLFGREIAQPRLTAWYGDAGKAITYSGLTLQPRPWTPALLEIKAAVEKAAGTTFNSVLLNLYRSGSDSVGWHADDEAQLGSNPVIASVSFGAERRFDLRHRTLKKLPKTSLLLTHGSLLLMAGPTQHNWQHQIPKTQKPVGGRVNLTFRMIS